MEADETEPQIRARISALASTVLGSDHLADKWLSSPKERFGGSTPFEMLASADGAKKVEELLLQAYFGNVG